jgi:hypothetical protein
MKELIVIAKGADRKKAFSPTNKSTHRVRHESERQLGSLRSVINTISRKGTPSVESIATELGNKNYAERASVLQALQRTHGNRYVQRVVAGIQAKLKIGQPNDIYEQEADRAAEEVMRMQEPLVPQQIEPEEEEEKKEEELIQTKPISEQITPLVQRQVDEEEKDEEENLQTKEISGQNAEVTPDLESRINAIRGGGQPLSKSERAFFEPRFGRNFGNVRVHDGPDAAQLASAIQARAFTVGWDIAFALGQYAPGTTMGRKLIAHELAHVLQQSAGRRASPKLQRQGTTHDSPPDRTRGTPARCAALSYAALPQERSPVRGTTSVGLELLAGDWDVDYEERRWTLRYESARDLLVAMLQIPAVGGDSPILPAEAVEQELDLPPGSLLLAPVRAGLIHYTFGHLAAAQQEEVREVIEGVLPVPEEAGSSFGAYFTARGRPHRSGYMYGGEGSEAYTQQEMRGLIDLYTTQGRSEMAMAAQVFLNLCPMEGWTSAINTYDNQVLTWGTGFGGHGQLPHLYARLDRDVKSFLVANAPERFSLSGVNLSQALRRDTNALGVLVYAAENDPYRELVLWAQFQTFLARTMSFSGLGRGPEIPTTDMPNLTLAVHLSHWLPAFFRYPTDLRRAMQLAGVGAVAGQAAAGEHEGGGGGVPQPAQAPGGTESPLLAATLLRVFISRMVNHAQWGEPVGQGRGVRLVKVHKFDPIGHFCNNLRHLFRSFPASPEVTAVLPALTGGSGFFQAVPLVSIPSGHMIIPAMPTQGTPTQGYDFGPML